MKSLVQIDGVEVELDAIIGKLDRATGWCVSQIRNLKDEIELIKDSSELKDRLACLSAAIERRDREIDRLKKEQERQISVAEEWQTLNREYFQEIKELREKHNDWSEDDSE